MKSCYKCRLILISLLALAILPQGVLAYKPTTTHAGLSQEIADFYNLRFARKLTGLEKELLIKGSVDEDAPVTRVLNHFYDPVRNIGINNGRTAKDWALAPLTGNEFSWSKALELYAEGDEEKALLALGRILHLLEDMAVPDHTRNDPHIGAGPQGMFTGESPFEEWTSDTKNRETLAGLAHTFYSQGLQPKILSSLDEYFDFLANYSNRNFYSKS